MDEPQAEPAEDGKAVLSSAGMKRLLPSDRIELKRQAETFGRIVWGLVGVLATIGGVIGLYQFFYAQPNSTSNDPQALLITMVSEGIISEDQADSLEKVLDGSSSELGENGSFSVNQALVAQDKESLIAMAQMLDRESRQQALTQLQNLAETSDDWQKIAVLAFQRDPLLALEAARKAVKLDMSDFRAASLLIQAQARSGDYLMAKRSAASARLLATTPLERIMAENAAMSVALQAGDKDQIAANYPSLKEAIDAYEASEGLSTYEAPISLEELEEHPQFLLGSIRLNQASAEFIQERYEDALATTRGSLQRLEALESQTDSIARRDVLKRQILAWNTLSTIHQKNENNKELITAQERVIQIWSDLTEAGDPTAEQQLAMAWAQFGRYAYAAKKIELASEAYENSASILKKLSRENPDNEDLRTAYEMAQMVSDVVSSETSNASAQFEDSLVSIDQAARELLDAPSDIELQIKFESRVKSAFQLMYLDPQKYTAQINMLLAKLDNTATAMERLNRSDYYIYLLRYLRSNMLGNMANYEGDLTSARQYFQEALSHANLVGSAPNSNSYDVERRGYTIHSMKLNAMRRMAMLEDNEALSSARSGLLFAQSLNAAGLLRTQEQSFLFYFAERVEELSDPEN